MRRWLCVAVLLAGACARSDAPPRPSSVARVDEIGATFHATKRWFGMVADLAFETNDDGTLSPRFETLHSPLVQRDDGAGFSLRVALPATASDAHTITLAGAPGFWVRTWEPAASRAPAEIVRGVVLYAGAIGGHDLLYKLTPTHVDEYLYVRVPPPTLTRRVRIETGPDVAGLRLTPDHQAVEVVDANRASLLRVSAPFARAADGTKRRGTIALEGHELVLEIDLRGLPAPVLIDPDWTTTGTMALGRWMGAGYLRSDNTVMVVGGCAGSGCPTTFARATCSQVLASTEVWTMPPGTWSTGAPLATARYAFGAVALSGGDYLVAGGCMVPGCTTVTDSIERYSFADEKWLPAGNLAHPRSNVMSAPLPGGDALFAGGCDTLACTTISDRYTTATGHLAAGGALAVPRGFGSSTVLGDGRVLVIGGCGDPACGGILGSAEVYDPAKDSWSPAGMLVSARAGHSATLLPDGTVLVAGGCGDMDCTNTLSTTELWSADPNTGGVFKPGPPMLAAHHDHAATLLQSGPVLVSGGAAGPITSTPNASVYVPDESRWAPIQPMKMDRAYHLAFLMPDGDVLATGGCNPTTCLPWCELYSPAGLPGELSTDSGTPVPDAGSDAGVDAGPDVQLAGPYTAHPTLFRTGAIRCATNLAQELLCPQGAFPLQDGDFQPDRHGYVTSAAAEVTDGFTGLTWQADDGAQRYTQAQAIEHCRTLVTPAAGAGQWRLPVVTELASLLHYGVNNPAIDPLFPNTLPTQYWTSSPVAGDSAMGWIVWFDGGEVMPWGANILHPARCVRGGPAPGGAPGHLRGAGPLSAGALTVTDDTTGLEWQRQDDGTRRKWQDSLAYCANLRLDGKTGWHVPNVAELGSLAEYASATNGVVIDTAFLQTMGDQYWSSTSNDGSPGLVFTVNFNQGVVDGVTVRGQAFARCVRHLDLPNPGGCGSDGCGCRVATPADTGCALLILLVVPAAFALRRRRRRTTRRRVLVVGLITGAVVLAFASEASALPSFARRTGMACPACHDAWPRLTDFGEMYRDNGYQLPGRQDQFNPIYESLPLSARASLLYQWQQIAQTPADRGAVTTHHGSIQAPGMDLFLGGSLASNISTLLVATGFTSGAPPAMESAWVRFSNLAGSSWFNVRFGLFELDLPASERRTLVLVAPYGFYHHHPADSRSAFEMGVNQLGIELAGHGTTTGPRYALALVSANGDPGSDLLWVTPTLYAHITETLLPMPRGLTRVRFGAFGYAGLWPTLPNTLTPPGGTPATAVPAPVAGTWHDERPFFFGGGELGASLGPLAHPLTFQAALGYGREHRGVVLYGTQDAEWVGGVAEAVWVPVLRAGIFTRYDFVRNMRRGNALLPVAQGDRQGVSLGGRWMFPIHLGDGHGASRGPVGEHRPSRREQPRRAVDLRGRLRCGAVRPCSWRCSRAAPRARAPA